MTNYLTVPGLGNSGPEHWQTYFEKQLMNCRRINQLNWDAPRCSDWIAAIDKEVSKYENNTVVLIGHSLGCATIAHWAEKYKKIIKGALLVAPSDLESPQYDFPAVGFNPIPRSKIGFKTVVVASTNDPWVTSERALYFADCWGSQVISLGKAGHINVASGYGQWNHGLELLNVFN